jgi:N-acetylglutamate synthase-like GNAT family acetyltransferase
MAKNLEFIFFKNEHANIFKALNLEWLKTFFVVEPYDYLVLNNPSKEIIETGGEIFMVSIEGNIIGTFAFLKKEKKLFEFSKMALTPSERGKGYGNKMVQFAIEFSRKQQWNTLILYSSTILENSIHLYRKYGFIEVPIDSDIKYARGNIKMALNLKK